jgi:hypothetical protein
MKKLFRVIDKDFPETPYIVHSDNIDEEMEHNKQSSETYDNCHWGQLKLFYSELEFLTIVSKKLDISKCLIVYSGAASGEKLNLLVKYYPQGRWLLYDPNPFKVKESENFIIKTGSNGNGDGPGWFNEGKIPEVLKIANGRKIIFITDIRLDDNDPYIRQKVIYNDMLIQQKWGMMMSAEFMQIKFRMFYYEKSSSEVDFIDNSYKDEQFFKDNAVIINKKDIKFDDMLYLAGTIYTQVYSPQRSGETRLVIKKIKYRDDAKKYNIRDQNKYVMKYYNNIKYESQLNHFNIYTRNEDYYFKKSKKLAKYIPGLDIKYTTATVYYIIYKYLKSVKKSAKFNDVLKMVIDITLFMNTRFNNNLVICILKRLSIKLASTNAALLVIKFRQKLEKIKITFEEQIKKLRKYKYIDNELKTKLIKSFDYFNLSHIIIIKDGKLKITKK